MRARLLVLIATVAALAAGSIALAGGAQATPRYSVSVEHCGGGIAIVGYSSRSAAVRADVRAVTRQRNHPHVLRTVQLFHGYRVIRKSTRHC
jgi:hypothetical protein